MSNNNPEPQPSEEELTFKAFATAALQGEADAEFRALWAARALDLRGKGLLAAASSAEHWATVGRPPAPIKVKKS